MFVYGFKKCDFLISIHFQNKYFFWSEKIVANSGINISRGLSLVHKFFLDILYNEIKLNFYLICQMSYSWRQFFNWALFPFPASTLEEQRTCHILSVLHHHNDYRYFSPSPLQSSPTLHLRLHQCFLSGFEYNRALEFRRTRMSHSSRRSPSARSRPSPAKDFRSNGSTWNSGAP